MKHAHEVTVAPIMNGVLVRAGCKTLFAKPEDLKGLEGYFAKGDAAKVPARFKRWVRDGEAFRGPEGPCAEETESCLDIKEGMSRPSFLDKSGAVVVHRITNGFVVERGRQCWGVEPAEDEKPEDTVYGLLAGVLS